MAVSLMEMAQKMAQAARAGVAIERKRLQEILAERQNKSHCRPGDSFLADDLITPPHPSFPFRNRLPKFPLIR